MKISKILKKLRAFVLFPFQIKHFLVFLRRNIAMLDHLSGNMI